VVVRFAPGGRHGARAVDLTPLPDISRERWVTATVWRTYPSQATKVEARRALRVTELGTALVELLTGLDPVP
jgi:hypothetical protein